MSDAVVFAAVALCVSLTGLACLLFGFDELLEEWFARGVLIEPDQCYPPFRWILWGRRNLACWGERNHYARFVIVNLPIYDWQRVDYGNRWGWVQRWVKWSDPYSLPRWDAAEHRWSAGWVDCDWDKPPPHR